jgi:hypothetical protein
MTGLVLQEVKDIEGLGAKVWTGGQEESLRSHKSEGCKPNVTASAPAHVVVLLER